MSDKDLLVRLVHSIRSTAPTAQRSKDVWDKTAIVLSALSSVVIAAGALLINSSIQRAQLASAEKSAASQVRTENTRTAVQLKEDLLSTDPARQRFALIALREAVASNDQMVVDMVRVVVESTKESTVREEAARTLAGSHDPRVATLLHSIAAESSTPALLKTTAYMASQQVAIRADLGQSTTIFYAAQPGGTAIETPEFKGGLFTHFLLADLQEDHDLAQKGQLQTDRLYATLSEQISHYRNEQGDVVIPLIESTGDRTVPLIPPATDGTIALIVGVSQYKDRPMSLQYADTDARSVRQFLSAHQTAKSATHLLLNGEATKSAIIASLNKAATEASQASTFILFYAGHGWNVNGEQFIAPYDLGIGDSSTPLRTAAQDVDLARSVVLSDIIRRQASENSISFRELKQLLNRIPSRHKVLFIDACSNNPFLTR